MRKLVIAEKPSVARSIAAVIGAEQKRNGYVEAIRTLQTIEAENRQATPDEQETLSRYVGWGGIHARCGDY